jgi:hypothetical protein
MTPNKQAFLNAVRLLVAQGEFERAHQELQERDDLQFYQQRLP